MRLCFSSSQLRLSILYMTTIHDMFVGSDLKYRLQPLWLSKLNSANCKMTIRFTMHVHSILEIVKTLLFMPLLLRRYLISQKKYAEIFPLFVLFIGPRRSKYVKILLLLEFEQPSRFLVAVPWTFLYML